MKKIQTFPVIFTFLLTTLASPVFSADQVEDRYLAHFEDQLTAKQNRLDDTARDVEVLKRQLDDQREQDRLQREALYKEYMEGLEFQRLQLKQQLDNLDEKRMLFEEELKRKQQEDRIRMSDKERKLQSSILSLDRLHKEIQEDQNDYRLRRKQLEIDRQQKSSVDQMNQQNRLQGAAPLENNKIRLTGLTGDQILGRSQMKEGYNNDEYYIEIGDVLDIDVWRVKDLSRPITVRPDGRISFPLVGDLDVVGMTLTDLRTVMTQKISDYVVNPQVSISVRQFGGRKFIILGEVGGPGVYRYQESISMLEAIGLAGGFSAEAGKGDILVIRGDIRKEPKVKVINIDTTKIWKEGMISENITVLPNDIIYVGKSYMGDYNKVLRELVTPLMDNLLDFFVLRSAIRTAQQKGA